MDAESFICKYNIGQRGEGKDIALNIKEIGAMLRSHTIDEIPQIIEDMCNVKW